jgi:hypothetical protein
MNTATLKDFPVLEPIDTTALSASIAKMDKIIAEFDQDLMYVGVVDRGVLQAGERDGGETFIMAGTTREALKSLQQDSGWSTAVVAPMTRGEIKAHARNLGIGYAVVFSSGDIDFAQAGGF